MAWWHFIIIIFVSYMIGNISISRIIAKKHNKDITKLGSGNAGSTNVLRNLGFLAGISNLALDILKGFIPAFLFSRVFSGSFANVNLIYLYTAGLSVMLGHIFPVVYGFRGGKGIASMLGVFLAADPLVTLIVIAVAAVAWILFNYGSVASFVCVTALTVIEGIKAKELVSPDNRIICIMLFAIFCLTWFLHRGNIERLLCGRESKVDLIKSVQKQINKSKMKKAVMKAKQDETVKPEPEIAKSELKSEIMRKNSKGE